MTKTDYMQLRANLDFKLRHAWLFTHALIDLALIALPVYLLWNHELSWSLESFARALGASIPLSVFYFRSFSMMHEGVHGLLASHRRTNDLLGIIYGAACFLPFAQWREIHLLHHYWSGNVEKDPVRRITLLFKQEPIFITKVMCFFWPTWLPAAAVMQNYVFWSESVVRLKKNPLAVASVTLPLALWAGIFAFAGLHLSLFVIIPSILIYLALVEMVNFPHHTDLPQYDGDTKFSLWEQHKTARSCFYPKMFERFVLLNFNYHIEHHLYPTLPWYRLESLSQRLRKEIPDYFFSDGNEWVRFNRKRPFREVCLSESSEKKAA